MKRTFRNTLRYRLLLILLGSITTGLVVVGVALYFQFRGLLYTQVENVIKEYVELAEQQLQHGEISIEDTLQLKVFADATARIIDCRISIIDSDGVVLADSEIPLAQMNEVENHLARPEVQQAGRQQFGLYRRRSTTIDEDLIYVAKQVRLPGDAVCYLRIALFATETNQMLNTARVYFVTGGLLILIVSAILVILLSRRLTQSLKMINRKARRISRGEFNDLVHTDSKDELGELGRSLNNMAAQLSVTLETLTRERRDLDTVLASIQDGILAIGKNKEITFYNDTALSLLEISISDASGKFFYEAVRNQHLNMLVDNFIERQVFISDEIKTNSRTLEVTITPFLGESDDHGVAVLVLRDISSYKNLEKVRRDFVANVSHEFKTPLAAIRGYSESLLDWGLADDKVNRRYLEKIVTQSHHLESLVSDVLQLARIERQQQTDLINFDAIEILKEVCAEFAEREAYQDRQLQPDVPSGKVNILGDPEMFRSIVTNLIDNALKYTHSGGTVTVSSSLKDNHAVIFIKDTGIGIPAKYHERIFERFYRVDKARSRDVGGTGLGLSIVKHLIEQQNATIWVISEPGVGSTFFTRFQLAEQ